MSKWIYSQKAEQFWNLDMVQKIRLGNGLIELIYDEDGGSNYVEFNTQEDLIDCWENLKSFLKG